MLLLLLCNRNLKALTENEFICKICSKPFQIHDEIKSKIQIIWTTIKHIKFLQTSIDLFWIRYLTTKALKVKVVKSHKKLLQII